MFDKFCIVFKPLSFIGKTGNDVVGYIHKMLQTETLKLKRITQWRVNCELCVTKLCIQFIVGPFAPTFMKEKGWSFSKIFPKREGVRISLKKVVAGKRRVCSKKEVSLTPTYPF